MEKENKEPNNNEEKDDLLYGFRHTPRIDPGVIVQGSILPSDPYSMEEMNTNAMSPNISENPSKHEIIQSAIDWLEKKKSDAAILNNVEVDIECGTVPTFSGNTIIGHEPSGGYTMIVKINGGAVDARKL